MGKDGRTPPIFYCTPSSSFLEICLSTRLVIQQSSSQYVAWWCSGRVPGCRTCDQQIVGSNPSRSAVECNPGQVIITYVPLLSRSIIWYKPMGGDALQLGM